MLPWNASRCRLTPAPMKAMGNMVGKGNGWAGRCSGDRTAGIHSRPGRAGGDTGVARCADSGAIARVHRRHPGGGYNIAQGVGHREIVKVHQFDDPFITFFAVIAEMKNGKRARFK